MDNEDKNKQGSEPMGVLGWILLIAALIGIAISLLARFKVSGFLGFDF